MEGPCCAITKAIAGPGGRPPLYHELSGSEAVIFYSAHLVLLSVVVPHSLHGRWSVRPNVAARPTHLDAEK